MNKTITLILLAFLCSCKAYKQDIMFKLDSKFSEAQLSTAILHAERNYVIQTNDYLEIDVYTNKGERLIDPNNELQQGMTGNNQRMREELSYLVQKDGTVKIPIVGQIHLDSLTLNQAEKLLEERFDEYYKDAFVKLSYSNKRVIVLGAVGGQLIPLTNENMSLLEVLALAGGLELGAKAQNIKIIRGALNKPEVYQINLSTIHGMTDTMINMEPGDVIYIEPWRRPWLQATKDIAPVLSLLSSTLALVLVLQNLK
ncbi:MULTISPECIES: polysaccharide biosynthesis/export family protein [Reichenbachiella]|uniref:Polysaccharide export outer membrane protein n=1 Tax=Reichenbachiella agariperforans TaxID=156994 RepID=A0A1M6TTR8_REIAG|nr:MULTISPECIES: polysaccharide biosynthesis/export family protein [Reichenbachiella]SHK60347.1 polysaccharide export outer membrane protein [Reichenbachiella agariperforans]